MTWKLVPYSGLKGLLAFSKFGVPVSGSLQIECFVVYIGGPSFRKAAKSEAAGKPSPIGSSS